MRLQMAVRVTGELPVAASLDEQEKDCQPLFRQPGLWRQVLQSFSESLHIAGASVPLNLRGEIQLVGQSVEESVKPFQLGQAAFPPRFVNSGGDVFERIAPPASPGMTKENLPEGKSTWKAPFT